jgi:cell division protease FtsH
MISYAGRVAEEIFFGGNLVTSGCISDIKKVTELLHKKYRVYGYSIKHLTTIDTKNISSDDKFLEREDLSIAEEASKLYDKTKEILVEYKDLVELLAKELLVKNSLSAKEIKVIVEPYFKDIKLGKVNTTIYDEGYVI